MVGLRVSKQAVSNVTVFNDDPDATDRLLRRRGSIRRLHEIMIVAAIVAVGSFAFAWWTIGLSIDAADAFTSAPPVTQWTGTAIITFIVSTLTAVVSWAIASTLSKK